MSKKEPVSNKNSSPKSHIPSESRTSKTDELDIQQKPSPVKSVEESISKDPPPIQNTKAKSEDIRTPLTQLDDGGDWAEESKFVLASQTIHDETTQERQVVLPAAYGFPRLLFLIRDPYWIFAFWEIPPENAHELLAKLERSWDQVHWVLRMYSPDKENANSDATWDSAIDPSAPGWYLHLSPPGTSFQGEIGLCDEGGRFVGLTCSNIALLPPDRPSPFVDEQWPITQADHETHYAGLPVALQQMSIKTMSPELIEQWQASRPTSRPNPFGKK
jgi:hypothetical protein